jgi:uncharacterized membrane protein (UPF0136 family)
MKNLFEIAVWSVAIYALVVALGGAVGYLKAKSKVSLMSGVGSGIVLLSAWFVTLQSPVAGLSLAAVIALALVVVFALRLFRTRAFMPAGLMTILSAIATAIFLLGLMDASR